MLNVVITSFTHIFKKPTDWLDRDCRPLHVRKVEYNSSDDTRSFSAFESAWQPTPKELEQLNNGGHVIVSIFGAQPPISLTVEDRAQDGT